jgi:hypothetical protein
MGAHVRGHAESPRRYPCPQLVRRDDTTLILEVQIALLQRHGAQYVIHTSIGQEIWLLRREIERALKTIAAMQNPAELLDQCVSGGSAIASRWVTEKLSQRT